MPSDEHLESTAALACPDHVPDDVRVHWQRFAAMLSARGTIDASDAVALELLATAYTQWVIAQSEVAEYGLVIKSANGYPVLNPYLNAAKAAAAQLERMLAKFGMTPAARGSLRRK